MTDFASLFFFCSSLSVCNGCVNSRRTGSPEAPNDEGIALRSKTDEKRGAAAENGEVHVANGAAV